MRKVILEACVETYDQCIAAEKNGANRIEFCDRLDLGGITPSFHLLEKLLANINIPVMVMVRPRGGDFVYMQKEFAIMKQTISTLKDMGSHGIVFGLLTPDKRVDLDRTGELVEWARPLPVTFHKAFDECTDMEGAIYDIRATGAKSVLTSGGKKYATDAVQTLNKLTKLAMPDLTIIAAGGITHENISELKVLLPATTEFHGRKIVPNI
ncbi:MAG TPA: copper homeostasis protein CutC [Bacteroidales bacterium]|nr:copper homeostasis protein CutC [Bacteroidales bacterium]